MEPKLRLRFLQEFHKLEPAEGTGARGNCFVSTSYSAAACCAAHVPPCAFGTHPVPPAPSMPQKLYDKGIISFTAGATLPRDKIPDHFRNRPKKGPQQKLPTLGLKREAFIQGGHESDK